MWGICGLKLFNFRLKKIKEKTATELRSRHKTFKRLTYQTWLQQQEYYDCSIPFQSHEVILYSGRSYYLIFPLLIM